MHLHGQSLLLRQSVAKQLPGPCCSFAAPEIGDVGDMRDGLARLQALLLHLHRKAQQLLPANARRAQRQRAVQPQRRRSVADAARDAERDGRGALRGQALAHTLSRCQLPHMAQRVSRAIRAKQKQGKKVLQEPRVFSISLQGKAARVSAKHMRGTER